MLILHFESCDNGLNDFYYLLTEFAFRITNRCTYQSCNCFLDSSFLTDFTCLHSNIKRRSIVGLTARPSREDWKRWNNECKLRSRWSVDLDRLQSGQNKSPVRFSLRGLKSKISKHMKKLPISSLCVLKELEASLRMGIYEDRQIHTKTGFRPIKLQESRSGPYTNRTPSNNKIYQTDKDQKTWKRVNSFRKFPLSIVFRKWKQKYKVLKRKRSYLFF